MARHEQDETGLFVCPTTGKRAEYVWTRHDRSGLFNACFHCTGERRTPGGDLHALQRRRQKKERRRP